MRLIKNCLEFFFRTVRMETEPKKKGRGRPPKAIKDGEATPKKSKATKRGRPKTDEGEYFIITYLI